MLTLVNNLVKSLSLLHPISNEVKSFFLHNCRVKKVGRGGFLLKPGEVCDKYYFIHEGVVRAFMREGDKEVTTWISSNNEMVTSIYSMLDNSPSVEYIQAIRQTLLLELDASALEQLLMEVPEFNVIARKLITTYYRDAEIRSFIARMPSAESRCNFYLKTYPEKSLVVPKKYIASFLGIREETLSRVMNKSK